MPRCPICRADVAEDAAAFPFCSPRCRLLDLGNWLDERYVVPAGDDTSEGSAEGDGEPAPPLPPPSRLRN